MYFQNHLLGIEDWFFFGFATTKDTKKHEIHFAGCERFVFAKAGLYRCLFLTYGTNGGQVVFLNLNSSF